MSSAPRRHQCMIYDGPPSRTLAGLAAAIRQQLAANTRCMYINSPTMVAGIRSQLYAVGTDVEYELKRGALVLVADKSHLVDGHFDIDRMLEMLEEAVHGALADGHAGLFATGDMTWELGSEKELSKLLEYEWRLEQLFRAQPALSGICQYHRDVLPRDAVIEGLISHPSLFISDTISRLNPHYVLARSPEDRRTAATAGLDDALSVLLAAEA
jgi:hypothetical protein